MSPRQHQPFAAPLHEHEPEPLPPVFPTCLVVRCPPYTHHAPVRQASLLEIVEIVKAGFSQERRRVIRWATIRLPEAVRHALCNAFTRLAND